MKIKKVYVIACQHGNEIFGLKILSKLAQKNHHDIKLKIGNLEAVSKRIRHIESDLNRSYGISSENTRESQIAGQITKEINAFGPDLIIDLHTSTVDLGLMSILPTDSPFLRAASHSLGMKKMAVMIEDVAKKSLIGTFPYNSVALEFGRYKRSDKLADKISESIARLVGQELPMNISEGLEVFHVQRVVPKSEIDSLSFSNFIFNEKLGGYPVLMGEKNYDDIAGFLAKKVT